MSCTRHNWPHDKEDCPTCAVELHIDHVKQVERMNKVLTPVREIHVAHTSDPLMDEAWALTRGDRNAQYGPAQEVFEHYAHVWTGLLGKKLEAPLDAADVARCMVGLKLARDAGRPKRDNIVDAHGYLSLLARIQGWIA